jgi:hypothetical protein
VDEAPAQPYRHTERERRLLRRALTPVDTSAGLMARVKAIETMVRLEVPVPHRKIEQALEDIRDQGEAMGTYQAGQAAAKAEKALAAYFGPDVLVWPSTTPDEPAPEGYWPYDDFGREHYPDLQDMEALDVGSAVDTQGRRDRWRSELEGEPPWRSGEAV